MASTARPVRAGRKLPMAGTAAKAFEVRAAKELRRRGAAGTRNDARGRATARRP
ncbi:hypothetical protein GCM10009761_00390 [Agromyces terreus]